jgi:threonine synthase
MTSRSRQYPEERPPDGPVAGNNRTLVQAGADLGPPDGDDPGRSQFAHDTRSARLISSDPEQTIEHRVEALEDVIESEVGDTLLVRARNIEREVGLRQIYLKFEGDNPSGTQKDRIAFAQAMDAMRRGFSCVTVATCGNYGVAMALASSAAGLRCLVHVPESYKTRRIAEIEAQGAEVIRTPGDYESVVATSRRTAAESEDVYDANPGGANTDLQLRAYGEIAYEIYDELRDAPAAVALPVSNGTTLAGVYRGFQSLYRRGKTSRIPRVVAGSSFGKNPIVQAFRRNTPSCEDLAPERIRETAINEPLVNWCSIDGDLALRAVRDTGGWAVNTSDRNMSRYAKLIREQQGLSVLPAATSGLIALLDGHASRELSEDRYVAILTARRS